MYVHDHGIIFNPMHNGIKWHNFTYASIDTRPIRAPRMIIHKRKFNHFNDDTFIMDASKICISTENTSVNGAANSIESNINGIVKRTLSPYFHITIRLHLTSRLLKFMQWLARKQYVLCSW